MRCTMPDGVTAIESLDAAARCLSEFSSEPAELAAAKFSLGATCNDQVLSTRYEAAAVERLDGRIPVSLVLSANEIFADRAVQVAPPGTRCRNSSELAIELLRTVVLQT